MLKSNMLLFPFLCSRPGTIDKVDFKLKWLLTTSNVVDDGGILSIIKGKEIKIIVPTNVKDFFLSWSRVNKTVGHGGVRRNLQKLHRRFWCLSMRQNVSNKVAGSLILET